MDFVIDLIVGSSWSEPSFLLFLSYECGQNKPRLGEAKAGTIEGGRTDGNFSGVVVACCDSEWRVPLR